MIIIDGHNLIPHIGGLSLTDLDDEMGLVNLLQEYARASRKQVMVFFDNAPPGFARKKGFGTVQAVFVPAGRTADDAIVQHLIQMTKNARRQARVVTSDRRVQAEAHALGATIIASDAFARTLASLPIQAEPPQAAQTPSTSNLDEWYDLFKIDPQQAERPIEPERKPRLKRPRSTSRGRGRKPSS